MRLPLIAVALLALPAAAQSTTAPPQWTAEITALTNAERAKAGCPALTLDDRLSKAAQAHTDEMARRATLSHEGADGSNAGQRASAAGYTWNAVAENIAAGQPSPAAAVASWMKSPGHRQNILNCAYRKAPTSAQSQSGTRPSPRAAPSPGAGTASAGTSCLPS
jgi:uncharacterized protein YkwD